LHSTHVAQFPSPIWLVMLPSPAGGEWSVAESEGEGEGGEGSGQAL
jgi:hypothetical protein